MVDRYPEMLDVVAYDTERLFDWENRGIYALHVENRGLWLLLLFGLREGVTYHVDLVRRQDLVLVLLLGDGDGRRHHISTVGFVNIKSVPSHT